MMIKSEERYLVFDEHTLRALVKESSVISMIKGIPSLDETYLRTYVRETVLTSNPGTTSGTDAYPLAYTGPIPKHLFSEEYITGVLGLEIPLNESQPFSPEFQKKVFEEHVVLEGFFSDFKKLGGDLKNAALALRYIFEDPKRIAQYVKAIAGDIKGLFDNAVKFINEFLENVKTLAEKVSDKIMAGLNKVVEFFGKLKKKLEGLLAGVKSMSGWKQAMLASGALVGMALLWDKLQEMAGDTLEKLKEVVNFVKEKLGGSSPEGEGPQLAKKEGYIHSLGLLESLDPDTEKLNEFLGGVFGKKNKDAEDFGLSIPAGGKVPSDGILISPEQAKSAGIAAKTPEEAEAEKADASGGDKEAGGDEASSGIMEQINAKVKELAKVALEKVKEWGLDFLKNLGVEFLTGALGGGIMAAFNALGKAFNGVKYVFKFLGPPLKKFIGMMKGDTDPKEEAKEAEQGIDDPTDPSTAKKDDETKKEALVRNYIRAKLLKEQFGNAIGSGDPAQEILQWAEEGNRVTVAGKNIWPGLGNRSGLHSYGDELTSKKWAKSGERLAKKIDGLPAGTEVELKRFKNINRDRGKWVTAGTVVTTGPVRSSGNSAPSRKVLRDIYESLGFIYERGIGKSHISSISVYSDFDEPFNGTNWEVIMKNGPRYIFPEDSSGEYAMWEDKHGEGFWETYTAY